MHVYKISINGTKYIVETKTRIPYSHAVTDAEIAGFIAGMKVTVATIPEPYPYTEPEERLTEIFELAKSMAHHRLECTVSGIDLMDANAVVVLQTYLAQRGQ